MTNEPKHNINHCDTFSPSLENGDFGCSYHEYLLSYIHTDNNLGIHVNVFHKYIYRCSIYRIDKSLFTKQHWDKHIYLFRNQKHIHIIFISSYPVIATSWDKCVFRMDSYIENNSRLLLFTSSGPLIENSSSLKTCLLKTCVDNMPAGDLVRERKKHGFTSFSQHISPFASEGSTHI